MAVRPREVLGVLPLAWSEPRPLLAVLPPGPMDPCHPLIYTAAPTCPSLPGLCPARLAAHRRCVQWGLGPAVGVHFVVTRREVALGTLCCGCAWCCTGPGDLVASACVPQAWGAGAASTCPMVRPSQEPRGAVQWGCACLTPEAGALFTGEVWEASGEVRNPQPGVLPSLLVGCLGLAMLVRVTSSSLPRPGALCSLTHSC